MTGMEVRQTRKFRINWNDMGIILTLIAMIVFFSLSTKSFLSARNFTNIVRQISVVGICAVGMTMVILTGGIDLSIGSVIGITSAIAAVMMSGGLPIWLAAAAALALGVAIGFVNSTCINYLKIPPMITTLAMMISLRGAVYLITGGMPVYGIPESFKVLGQVTLGRVPDLSMHHDRGGSSSANPPGPDGVRPEDLPASAAPWSRRGSRAST